MTDLRDVDSSEQAGQSFITFAQRKGASVVHTFFGTEPEKQSVSTLPSSYVQDEGRLALSGKNYIAETIRAGAPRNIWGVDFLLDTVSKTDLGRASVAGRFSNFQQRSTVTFSMPNADNTFGGAGIGIGFEDRGTQFLKRMEESGGAFSVAAFAAYSRMLTFSNILDEDSPLSPRQTEILQLLTLGYRLGDIADRLKISDSAVNLYLSKLRFKLGVRTKEQAMAMAISKGWIAL